jgi:hypothetical protein
LSIVAQVEHEAVEGLALLVELVEDLHQVAGRPLLEGPDPDVGVARLDHTAADGGDLHDVPHDLHRLRAVEVVSVDLDRDLRALAPAHQLYGLEERHVLRAVAGIRPVFRLLGRTDRHDLVSGANTRPIGGGALDG